MKFSTFFSALALIILTTPLFAIEHTKNTTLVSGATDKVFDILFDKASLSLSGGINFYHGDIVPYNFFPKFNQFNESVKDGFKISYAKEIKWGLGGQLNFQSGSFQGTRTTGAQSPTVSFENDFFDLSLQVRYSLIDLLLKKNEYNRFKLYGFLGIGSTWYRSKLYDTDTKKTRDFEGFVEFENTQNLARKVLSDKIGKTRTWSVPFGLTLAYQLNHKTDIHLDVTHTTTNTDRLDAFSRGASSRDKYSYIGLGLTFKFKTTEDDFPKKRPKKVKEEDDDADDENANDGDTSSKKSDKEGIRRSIFSRRNKKNKKSKKGNDDELLNIRLKLFETQLKLFEMQYLLGN